MTRQRIVDVLVVAMVATASVLVMGDRLPQPAGAGPGGTRARDGLTPAAGDASKAPGRGTAPRSGGSATPPEFDSPVAIPPRHWWAIIRRVVAQFLDHRLMAEAAGVVFFVLLSIFPAIAALVSLYGLFTDPGTISDQVGALAGLLPGGGIDIVRDQVTRVSANGGARLGVGLVFGLAVSLWSSNQGMKAMFDVLNVVYDEQEKRGYVRLTLVTLGCTAGALLFAVLAMGAVVALPIVLGFVGLSGTSDTLLRLLRWPALLAVVTLVLAALYRIGPSRAHARWRWITPGSLFAALSWVALSFGFSWYVANFGSYNKTYGALGAAVGFMTWIWLSTIVVLLGAELNAEMEHETAADTTTGPPHPAGARGATKADEVAGAPILQ